MGFFIAIPEPQSERGSQRALDNEGFPSVLNPRLPLIGSRENPAFFTKSKFLTWRDNRFEFGERKRTDKNATEE